MAKTLIPVLTILGLLAAGAAPLSAAEEPPASAQERTLRVGDTITWTPEAGSQHRLRFGGTVTHKGAPLPLTKFDDVKKVLENFNPPPPSPDADGVVSWPAGTQVTAKVKGDTGTPPVAEFFFTCGFGPHNNAMVTDTFKVDPATPGQPARNIQIISAHDNAPIRWVLRTTPGNPTGDKSLRRP